MNITATSRPATPYRSASSEDLELEEFTPENCAATKGAKALPTVSMKRKSGLIVFNTAATVKLSLKKDDLIILLQNKKEKENWYVEKNVKTGFKLKEYGPKSVSLSFNNSTLVQKILDSLDLSDRIDPKATIRFLVSGEPTKFGERIFYGLLYKYDETKK